MVQIRPAMKPPFRVELERTIYFQETREKQQLSFSKLGRLGQPPAPYIHF